MKKIFIISMIVFVVFGVFGLTFAEAREFADAIKGIGDDLREILMALGVIALMVSGGAFYFSKALGLDKLVGAIIGTVIFAASSTIFMIIYHAFN